MDEKWTLNLAPSRPDLPFGYTRGYVLKEVATS